MRVNGLKNLSFLPMMLGIHILFLSACTNSFRDYALTGSTGTVGGTGAVTVTGDSLIISTVNIVAPSSGGANATYTTSVFFDTTKSTAPATTHCNATSGTAVTAKPCVCQFTWQEINQTSGASIPIPRSVQTTISSVQPGMVQCNAPGVYSNDLEVPKGTVIKVAVLPGPGNGDAFTVPGFNYTKGTGGVLGSFQDAQGHSFDNILRYSCYEQFKRGMSITNKVNQVPNPTTGENANVVSASQFCVAKANSTGQVTQGCQTLPPPENSAQSYYYNLFIRSSERGDINTGNLRYVCPHIKEALGNNGTVGTQGDYWPLDSSFALSLAPTPDFNVGVEAFTKTSNGSDPVSATSSCAALTGGTGSGTGSSGGTQDAASLIKSCLGFGTKPNSDGTCPYFRDANNNIRLTYRLRRYVAIYPPTFDTDGSPINQAQATDVVYVLDRPVASNTADPLKPFTMRGPKPCPFAFFDNKAVTQIPDVLALGYANGVVPGYVATNNTRWTGTNVDGIQFPNVDDGSINSCSAAVPVLNDAKTVMSIATVNRSFNPAYPSLYIRPIRAWTPHYEEDTDFQACAPQSSPLRDPPLHFSRDSATGNVSWCAEVYPSQNDNITALDTRANISANFRGGVAPFTSHVVKNSASAQCSRSLPTVPAAYPAAGAGCSTNVFDTGAGTCTLAGTCSATSDPTLCNPTAAVALHPSNYQWDYRCDKAASPPTAVPVCTNNTCDRTVVATGQGWPRFPLLARAPQVESAIAGDSTYNCTVSYDNSGPKTDKKTPTQGCCGPSTDVWTGIAAGANPAATLVIKSAHLEPDAPCLVPQY